jgi:hypothetical protein
MKRLIGLCGIATFVTFSCVALESNAANNETVSDLSTLSTYEFHGYDYDFYPVDLVQEIPSVKDYSFTFVVEAVFTNPIYKAVPVASCRSPGKITPKRF